MSSRVAVALVVTLLGACGGAALQGRTSAVDELIVTARDNGAQRCAPIELAMAESHIAFARQEMSEGDLYRAREEIAVAEENVHAAIRKSPRALCAPQSAKKPPRQKLVVTPSDKDGDGLSDDIDDCPDRPEDKDGFKDDDGCPDEDDDGDGLADAVDSCPRDAEDKDGFKDDDGCPEGDNDKDGLTDAVDQCPDQPEDKDGFKDDDGCPDCDNDDDGVPECPQVVDKCPDQAAKTPDGCPQKYKLVVVTEEKIELKQTIYFATNKARIKPVSFPLLDEVAEVMADKPEISVRIEGHTDSRGRDKKNQRLSRARAKAVRNYLIKRGVASDRMVATGFGEAVPIADNRTKAGRAQNRRVEFVITKR